MATCKLNKLGCPPVGESLHKVGHCYCYLCTCGKHFCPSLLKRSRPSLAHINSSYRRTFVGRHITPSAKFVRQGELKQSLSPMEFKTTGAQDYASPPTPPPQSPPKPVQPEYSFKFEAHSSYRDEFVDWKMPGIPPKKIQPIQAVQTAHLAADTSYSRAFNTLRGSAYPSTAFKPLSELRLGLKQGLKPASTSRLAYKSHSPDAHAVRVLPPPEEPRSVEASRKHFVTTYSSAFQKAGSARQFPTYDQLKKARLHR